MLKILSDKPELVASFPPWMLSGALEKELKATKGLAIGEIAGRDSVAAVLAAAREGSLKALLPTIAFTGTEFGDWDIPFKKVELVKAKLSERGIRVFDPVVLGAPRWWWRLCGRYVTSLFQRFGFYSPCVGCHLYLHAVRIPLAAKIDCQVIIGGERESHGGKIKINQIAAALDAYTSFARGFGIELVLPLRNIGSNEDVASIIDSPGHQHDEQLGCVLSKNYLDESGMAACPEDAIKQFYDEFALREAARLVSEALAEHRYGADD